ncbi:carbon storage regulator [Roseimaritima sediminicola]|uniref:carbon storage regulator n=1 Tax=Roseimaritima sediminicola TaxID=2662066 RepID=UPI00129851EE|nr:carbon storage regulator [Roseimaritima sediminicola]
MLVLSRKLNEKIQLGDNITVTVLRVQGNTIRLGIDAPRDVRILRGELEPLDNDRTSKDQLFKMLSGDEAPAADAPAGEAGSDAAGHSASNGPAAETRRQRPAPGPRAMASAAPRSAAPRGKAPAGLDAGPARRGSISGSAARPLAAYMTSATS